MVRSTVCALVVLVAPLFGLPHVFTRADAAGQQAEAPGAPAAQPGVRPLYRLQRGDEITVKVFNQPELLETVVIRPDGRISLGLLDDVEAVGATVPELDAVLTTGYRKFFQDPQVSVIVRSFANLRVYVGGEVTQPGPVPIPGEMNALQAIFQVGGFRPTARLDSVMLVRNDPSDRAAVQRLDFRDLTKNPDVALQPFDVIYVPPSRITKVDRFIDQYVRQLLPISLTAGFTYVLGDRVAVVSEP